jgi:CO/xanthine dehydrogenase Mo-binding subunit
MQRGGAYRACVCQISITPGTGKLTVDKRTIAVDPGIAINPMQLKRQVGRHDGHQPCPP